jgi:hypothetical protein
VKYKPLIDRNGDQMWIHIPYNIVAFFGKFFEFFGYIISRINGGSLFILFIVFGALLVGGGLLTSSIRNDNATRKIRDDNVALIGTANMSRFKSLGNSDSKWVPGPWNVYTTIEYDPASLLPATSTCDNNSR